MPPLGGDKGREKTPVETDAAKMAEIGTAVEWELCRYRQTLADIDKNTAERKLSAQGMFASRIEAIVQRVNPLVSRISSAANKEGDSPE